LAEGGIPVPARRRGRVDGCGFGSIARQSVTDFANLRCRPASHSHHLILMGRGGTLTRGPTTVILAGGELLNRMESTLGRGHWKVNLAEKPVGVQDQTRARADLRL